MVVLVTGGSGFIGGHVVDALLDEGMSVRVLDKAKPINDRIDWFKGDIMSKEDAHDAMQDVDAVFHLAAVADVNVAESDTELCIKVNELGTLNLLRACSDLVERFILASTVWVYGRQEGITAEEAAIPHPNNLYTKTKIGQEQLVHSWGESHSLPFTILRYDIPYGPRMRANMAIAAFVRRAIRKDPITIYGDGQQGRCWIFVSDLASAHRLALSKAASNQIINIAGNEFVTISRIAELLSEKLGAFPVTHEPARSGDFGGVRTSIEKARRLIGWYPTTSFSEGLSKYIEYVKAEMV